MMTWPITQEVAASFGQYELAIERPQRAAELLGVHLEQVPDLHRLFKILLRGSPQRRAAPKYPVRRRGLSTHHRHRLPVAARGHPVHALQLCFDGIEPQIAFLLTVDNS